MMYRLPLEMMAEVVNKNDELQEGYKQFTLQVMPSLAIQYYGFQHMDKIFSKKAYLHMINF